MEPYPAPGGFGLRRQSGQLAKASRTVRALLTFALLWLDPWVACASPADPSVHMMIVVDRSGSVQRAGVGAAIRKALTDFVTNTPADAAGGRPALVDGRDAIGIGSFGGSWKLEFAPASSFRSGEPNIVAAIRDIQFFNGVTNTAEGLYHAYTELRRLGNARSLNIIVLLTDGRPNAFTATFDVPRACDASGKKTGYVTAMIGRTWPPLPPLIQGGQGIYTLGLFKSDWTPTGDMTLVDNSAGCKFADGGRNFHADAPEFPATDAYGNSTTGPVYAVDERSTASPRAVRYAAINAADNMATTIRKDMALRPVLMVIGLNQPAVAGEPLDAAWLMRIANDGSIQDPNGRRIPRTEQTMGWYFDATPSTLQSAFQRITSLVLIATPPPQPRR